MKKTLFFLASSMLLFGTTMKSQTALSADKTWDFGNDASWTGYAGAPAGSTITVVDNLGIFPHGSSTSLMGQVVANTSTPGFSDGYTYIQRMQFNGASAASGVNPTSRYLKFLVSGACKVTVWMKASSGARSILLSDGSTVVSTFTAPDSTTGVMGTYEYSGSTAKTFTLSDDNATYIYKINVDFPPYVTLATNGATVKNTANIFTNGNQVYLNKISSDTKVSVYNANGGLVKSFNTKTDSNFELQAGYYIVNLQSKDGIKSEKILIK
jgi:hypothetical protein